MMQGNSTTRETIIVGFRVPPGLKEPVRIIWGSTNPIRMPNLGDENRTVQAVQECIAT